MAPSLCGTKATDKEMCLSLSVSSLVDLASAKNNYMKEPNCMSRKFLMVRW